MKNLISGLRGGDTAALRDRGNEDAIAKLSEVFPVCVVCVWFEEWGEECMYCVYMLW